MVTISAVRMSPWSSRCTLVECRYNNGSMIGMDYEYIVFIDLTPRLNQGDTDATTYYMNTIAIFSICLPLPWKCHAYWSRRLAKTPKVVSSTMTSSVDDGLVSCYWGNLSARRKGKADWVLLIVRISPSWSYRFSKAVSGCGRCATAEWIDSVELNVLLNRLWATLPQHSYWGQRKWSSIQSQRGGNAKCLVVYRAKYGVMGNNGQSLVSPHGEVESGYRQPLLYSS